MIRRLVPVKAPSWATIPERDAHREMAARTEERDAPLDELAWLLKMLQDLECGHDVEALAGAAPDELVECQGMDVIEPVMIPGALDRGLVKIEAGDRVTLPLRRGEEVSSAAPDIKESTTPRSRILEELAVVPPDTRRGRHVAHGVRLLVPPGARRRHRIEEVEVAPVAPVQGVGARAGA
jgi:hypothetical protein